MASNFTVVVIGQNARRFNMKVNTNTTLLTVLEDACKKQELNPIEWDLTHHNKVVELANSIRFSGIPNNATLEMVETTKTRKESSVNLGLQLESGKRLQAPFLPHQTLWEVLEHWASQGEMVYPEKNKEMNTQPVCIYMRQEVIGEEQLKNKTLRSLGLTQGSAMIRLLHRSASQLKHQANVSAPLSKTVSNVPAPSGFSNTRLQPKPLDKQEFNSSESIPKESEPMDLSSISSQSETGRTSPDVALSSTSSRSAGDSTQEQSVSDLKELEQKQNSVIQEPLPPAIRNAQRFSTEGQFNLLGARDATLFHGDDVVVSTSQDSLQDEFFDVTISDVRKMYRDLKEKRTQMEEAPFKTTSARELERDANILRQLHDYPNTIVRIRFGNRFVLQGSFRTADTIATVESWLREFLSVPELNFYLFATPPKKVFNKETRLVEEGLVGMAVIYFGSEDPSAPIDQKVLKPEVYEKVSDPVAVFEFTRRKLRKEKAGGNMSSSSTPDEQQSSSSSDQSHKSQSQPGSSSENGPVRKPPAPQQPRNTGAAGGGNVPKWFKLAK